MVSKSKNYFSPMLVCWNDIKIHLGFEDSYFVPPTTYNSSNISTRFSTQKTNKHVSLFFTAFGAS